jgi:starvation-inducible DNA-binding protein
MPMRSPAPTLVVEPMTRRSRTVSTDLQLAPETAQLAAASWLQRLVPQLVAVTLDAKQAHWNVTGPCFLPLHQLTDHLAGDARRWTDRAAERALALGLAIDARAATVASSARDFPAGELTDREVIGELIASLDRAIATARRSLSDLERWDLVAHGITLEILEGLEHHRWLLRAQKS